LPVAHNSQTRSFSAADIDARRSLIATFVYEAANQAARMTMVQRPIKTTSISRRGIRE